MQTLKHNLGDILMYAAVIIGTLILFIFVLLNTNIPSPSMEPTLMPGDRLIANRISYDFLGKEIQRGDIVMFKHEGEGNKILIKRVIGMPGETLTIGDDGKVYIDGVPMDEPYLPVDVLTTYGEQNVFQIPEGSYFVMGDNRDHSHDARYWENHFVSRDEIIAEPIFRYYPFSAFGKID